MTANRPLSATKPDAATPLDGAAIDAMRLWFPHVLRGIADRFGNGVALRLAEHHGGQYLYLPAKANASHPLARKFGLPVLAHLIEKCGGMERLTVPLATRAKAEIRNAEAWQMLRQGHTVNAVADACNMHVRQVQRVRAGMAKALASKPKKRKSP